MIILTGRQVAGYVVLGMSSGFFLRGLFNVAFGESLVVRIFIGLALAVVGALLSWPRKVSA